MLLDKFRLGKETTLYQTNKKKTFFCEDYYLTPYLSLILNQNSLHCAILSI